MARREYHYGARCSFEGCVEVGHYYVSTRRELGDLMQRYDGRWRCVRHTRPDEVLSAENAVREVVLTSVQDGPGRYWREEGQEKGGSGFNHGPGFKAYTKDFPAGTRLIVTARIELPGEEGASHGD